MVTEIRSPRFAIPLGEERRELRRAAHEHAYAEQASGGGAELEVEIVQLERFGDAIGDDPSISSAHHAEA
jgi:hypothetical protein